MTYNPSRRNGAHKQQDSPLKKASTTTFRRSPAKAKTTTTAKPDESAASRTGNAEVIELTAWWTYEQVCTYVGETRHTVNKWRKSPERDFPKAFRAPNGSLRFKAADVVAWWTDNLVEVA